MIRFTEVITDCDKSPHLGVDGMTAAELDQWCLDNGCRWIDAGPSAAYITAECGCKSCRDATR